jgi:transposase
MIITSSYDFAFKMKLVEESMLGKKSIKSISNFYKLSDSMLRKWIDQYNHYGIEGLKPKHKKQYSNAFKLLAVTDFYDNKLTLRECCLKFNISGFSTLTGWLIKYDRQGSQGFSSQSKRDKIMEERGKIKKSGNQLSREELEKENLYLKAENAFLKKLEALTVKKKRKK